MSMTKIGELKQALELTNYEISQKELIRDSLLESLVRQVRALDFPYDENILHKAFLQQNNKKKSERSMYEYVKKDLIENIFHNDEKAKLKSISLVGYDNRCYEFFFSYQGENFEVKIPNLAAVTIDNVINSDVNYGRYSLYRESKQSYWELMTRDYSLAEIGESIKRYFEEKENIHPL